MHAEPARRDEFGHAMPDGGGSAKPLLSGWFSCTWSWLEVQCCRSGRGMTSGGGSQSRSSSRNNWVCSVPVLGTGAWAACRRDTLA